MAKMDGLVPTAEDASAGQGAGRSDVRRRCQARMFRVKVHGYPWAWDAKVDQRAEARPLRVVRGQLCLVALVQERRVERAQRDELKFRKLAERGARMGALPGAWDDARVAQRDVAQQDAARRAELPQLARQVSEAQDAAQQWARLLALEFSEQREERVMAQVQHASQLALPEPEQEQRSPVVMRASRVRRQVTRLPEPGWDASGPLSPRHRENPSRL